MEDGKGRHRDEIHDDSLLKCFKYSILKEE